MTPKKILLVEDHPVMRDTCIQFINRQDDFEVCAAVATAEEALQQAPLLKPDLVLVDISLPRMNGIELTEKLRTAEPALPVLIMTGHGDEHYREMALGVGAVGLVFKYDGPVALIKAIERALAGR